MNISIVYGLEGDSAYGFLRPLIAIDKIKKILSFPYSQGINNAKLVYHLPVFSKNKFLINIVKLFQMIINIPIDCKLIIGIYELPHGFLALIVGKIKNIPCCINVIGNPGYEKIRSGFRKSLTYFMLRNADAVTVCGNNSKKILVNNGVDSARVYILPNPLHAKEFEKKDIKKIFDIVSIGSLINEKKIENLLIIIKEIKKINKKVSVGIGGDGPNRSSLEKV